MRSRREIPEIEGQDMQIHGSGGRGKGMEELRQPGERVAADQGGEKRQARWTEWVTLGLELLEWSSACSG